MSQQIAIPTGSSAAVLDRYGQVMMNTFGVPKRVFVRGEGCTIFDADGRQYLDLLAGLAVNSLGHAHPLVVSAVTSQLSTLGHVSNFFSTPSQVALGERLAGFAVANAPQTQARVFFTNSGTEANEAAFKIARRTGRTKIISTEGAFHGRTMGALALTHNPAYREPFEPLPGDVQFVPYDDVAALDEAVDESVAAVVLEPIQGENGIIVPQPGYLRAAREITERQNALLWIDEVQTGIGRTGAWLAHIAEGITADVVTVAKGLGNGFPIGACIATGTAARLLGPGSHGTTFGGNPVAAMAGLAVLSVIERDDLLSQVIRLGRHLVTAVRALNDPRIVEVRGRGLLCGIVLADAIAATVADFALDQGFIINAPRPNVLRIAPPLIVTAAQLDQFVSVLPRLLNGATGSAG